MSVVIGHRGASKDHPENTCEAFRGAARQGATWVELDVRRSLDGVLVVHHDPVLPDGRTICDTVRRELPASVATLVEAFAACESMGVNVEIKNSPSEPGYDPTDGLVSATLEVIDATASGMGVLISSFDLATLDAVRRHDADVPTGYLVLDIDQPDDAIAVAVERGHQAINPWNPTVDRTVVDRCHERGLAVNVWTVDDPHRIVELASWGVDGIITNVPAVAIEALSA